MLFWQLKRQNNMSVGVLNYLCIVLVLFVKDNII